jgi:hypothetical protein
MKKTKHVLILLLSVSISALFGCTTQPELSSPIDANAPSTNTTLTLTGQWLLDANGELIIDPQPSGLTMWQEQLVMIADASANDTQVKRLHFINPLNAQRTALSPIYQISPDLTQSCFNQYLLSKPDLEALVKDPANPNGFITVTEDASTLGKLTDACQVAFRETNSTVYPTVLVRLHWDGAQLTVTGVRAVQFPKNAQIGNSPNDGVEGLSIDGNTLFIALEKDAHYRARVFTTELDEEFWLDNGFVQVVDQKLSIPELNQPSKRSVPHPINGSDIFEYNGSKWLLAAARNDNQLWLIDIAKQRPTKIVNLRFMAPTQLGSQFAALDCPATTLMDNASLEGVAVAEGNVYLVNDPWKRNYWKNIKCESTRSAYAEHMNGLLFTTTVAELFRHARDMSAE